jgi:hypothetical protein
MTFSRAFYEPYVVKTGDAVVRPDGSTLGPAPYEVAYEAALLEKTRLLIQIQEIEFETRDALAAAFAKTRCAVRFVRAERLTVGTARTAPELSGWLTSQKR